MWAWPVSVGGAWGLGVILCFILTETGMSYWSYVSMWLTGSRSGGSDCSDGQKERAGGSQSEPAKQEVGSSSDKQLAAASPDYDRNQQPPSSFPKDLPPAPSPARGRHRDLATARQSFCLAIGNPGDFFVDVMWPNAPDIRTERLLLWKDSCVYRK